MTKELGSMLTVWGKHQEELLRISKAAYYLLSNSLDSINKVDVLL